MHRPTLILLVALALPAAAHAGTPAAPAPAPAAATRAAPRPSTVAARAWDHLIDHAGLKLGSFSLVVAGVAALPSKDAAVTAWATTARPLGGADVLGQNAPTVLLAGTGAALLGLATLGPKPERARRWTDLEAFFVSQSITAGLTGVLKVGVGRLRPDGHDHRSFPSGHTSSAFAWATFVWQRYGWQWGLPAYAVAGFVGLSRIQDDRHYLTDVLAGALLGTAVTYVVDVCYAAAEGN